MYIDRYIKGERGGKKGSGGCANGERELDIISREELGVCVCEERGGRILGEGFGGWLYRFGMGGGERKGAWR